MLTREKNGLEVSIGTDKKKEVELAWTWIHIAKKWRQHFQHNRYSCRCRIRGRPRNDYLEKRSGVRNGDSRIPTTEWSWRLKTELDGRSL